jgi:hypothetical protein
VRQTSAPRSAEDWDECRNWRNQHNFRRYGNWGRSLAKEESRVKVDLAFAFCQKSRICGAYRLRLVGAGAAASPHRAPHSGQVRLRKTSTCSRVRLERGRYSVHCNATALWASAATVLAGPRVVPNFADAPASHHPVVAPASAGCRTPWLGFRRFGNRKCRLRAMLRLGKGHHA